MVYRRSFVILSLLVVLSMMSATMVPLAGAQGGREIKNPDTFIIGHYGEPESLDPAYTYETSGSAIEYNIYEGLIAFKREKADEFVPSLAEKWSVSDDGLTWTFNIRKGVKFHAGGTLEPHDVAYSLQRSMLQDRVDGPQALLLEPFLGVSTVLDKVNEVGKLGLEDPTTILLPGATPTVAESEGMTETAATGPVASEPAKVAQAAEDVCKLLKDQVKEDDAAGTVTLTLTQPAPWLLQIISQSFGAVVDKEWQGEQGDWDGDCTTWGKWHNPAADKSVLFAKANGTGPYMLDHWTPGEEIVLTANENYWRTEELWPGAPTGAPRIKRVNFRLVEEWGTRFSMLQAGDIDYGDVDAAFYPQADPLVKTFYRGADDKAPADKGADDGILIVYTNLLSPEMTGAMFNQKINIEGGNTFIGSGQLDGAGIPADFFSDIHVRKAFNYCYDWDAHIKEALQGEAIQPRGPIIQGMLGATDEPPTYSHDADKCTSEFKEAWGGKLWDTGFSMQLVYNTGNDLRRIAAEIIKQNVEAINPKFQIEVVNLPWASFLEIRTSGKLPILISGWLEDYHDPSNWVHPFMHPTAGSYSRTQNFSPAFAQKVIELIDKGVATVDPAEREPIYKELQKMANDEAISIFLYQLLRRRYWQDWVKGWYFNPLHPEPYALIYNLSKEY